MTTLSKEILLKAATLARGLAIDAVHACQSGHLGLPLGCAEVGAVLFGNVLRYNPDHPEWLDRDRFVLSAEPERDRRDVDTGVEQVHGAGVAEHVWREVFRFQ